MTPSKWFIPSFSGDLRLEADGDKATRLEIYKPTPAFLTPDEHESWAKTRSIIVEGGLSGHTYAVAHRRSPLAVRFGRICYDLTEDKVMHFHDWGVPPEEEVLATKLILEHREPWLRNEATALGHDSDIYKNPFGDGMDGVADAIFTQSLGGALAGIAAVRRK